MEINFLFNAHKTYYDDFLGNLANHLFEMRREVMFLDDFIIYKLNNMEVLIDHNASVYIKYEVKNLENINEVIYKVIEEYKFLVSLEVRFHKDSPVKLFISKEYFAQKFTKNVVIPYDMLPLKDEVSLTMSI